MRRVVRGSRILITGASSGIGRALAGLVAEAGARVAIVARSTDKLDDLARELTVRTKAEVLSITADVTSEADRRRMLDTVVDQFGGLDVLVNNAGVGLSGGLLDISLDDWNWVLSVNLFGVIHGLHFFVPPMVKRDSGGHVVDVSSGLGLVGAPEVIGYVASKFAVAGLSESLRAELRPFGIGVSTICPGFIRTSIFADSRMRGPDPEA